MTELRQKAFTECQEMQTDAEHYADGVLDDLEQKLRKILSIVQNGRQQLESVAD